MNSFQPSRLSFRPRTAVPATHLLIGLGMLGLAAIGCGKQEMREGFAPVHGKVTLDEKPLPNAQVEFETPLGHSYGRTDENGDYVAEYSRGLSGAGKGQVTVRIRTSVVFPDEDTSRLKYDDDSGEYLKPELVPTQYNTQSTLTVEITDDGAPYNFDLKSQPAD